MASLAENLKLLTDEDLLARFQAERPNRPERLVCYQEIAARGLEGRLAGGPSVAGARPRPGEMVLFTVRNGLLGFGNATSRAGALVWLFALMALLILRHPVVVVPIILMLVLPPLISKGIVVTDRALHNVWSLVGLWPVKWELFDFAGHSVFSTTETAVLEDPPAPGRNMISSSTVFCNERERVAIPMLLSLKKTADLFEAVAWAAARNGAPFYKTPLCYGSNPYYPSTRSKPRFFQRYPADGSAPLDEFLRRAGSALFQLGSAHFGLTNLERAARHLTALERNPASPEPGPALAPDPAELCPGISWRPGEAVLAVFPISRLQWLFQNNGWGLVGYIFLTNVRLLNVPREGGPPLAEVDLSPGRTNIHSYLGSLGFIFSPTHQQYFSPMQTAFTPVVDIARLFTPARVNSWDDAPR